MTDNPTKDDGLMVLLDRLFHAFGKEGTKKQVDEWLALMRKVRPDDAAVAVQSLIETSNRFPTIAEFRTAAMQAYTVRIDAAKDMTDVSPIVRRIEAEAKREDFEWWRDRFGSYAPNVRQLVNETCSNAVKPWNTSGRFATLINELQAEPDHRVRYERMQELAATVNFGERQPEQPVADLVGF